MLIGGNLSSEVRAVFVRDYLEGQNRGRPDRLAYVCSDERRTWGATAERSQRFAAALQGLAVRPGDVIAFLGRDGHELVETWFACATLGSVRTGINWRYAPREVEHILRDASVRVLVVEGGECEETLGRIDRSRLPNLEYVVGFGDHGQDLDYESLIARADPLVPAEWPELADDDPLAISYTTGSTGLPKGAIWSQSAVVAAELHTWLQSGARHDDVFLHCLPAAGVPVLLATWNVFVGNTIVLLPQFSAGEALRLFESEHVTSTLLVPTMMHDILNHPALDTTPLDSLRLVIYGSSPATPALVREAISRFGCELQQWYGSTEGIGGWFSILHHDEHLYALEHDPDLLQSCGRPTVHTEIEIRDPDGGRLPVGDVGEIAIRSSACMEGYLNMPEETAEVMCDDGFLVTGDMGRVDDRGYLYLVDRKKFMIITGAYNVYPVVVENVLAEHPDVAEVCVVGAPDERWGEIVSAVVVPRPGAVPDVEDLIGFCKEHLAKFEVPKRIEIWDELPRGATGKLQKRAVKDWFAQKTAGSSS